MPMVFAFFAPDQDSSLPCHLIVRDIVNPVVTPGPRKPQKQIIAASLNITSPISSDLPVSDTGHSLQRTCFHMASGLGASGTWPPGHAACGSWPCAPRQSLGGHSSSCLLAHEHQHPPRHKAYTVLPTSTSIQRLTFHTTGL